MDSRPGSTKGVTDDLPVAREHPLDPLSCGRNRIGPQQRLRRLRAGLPRKRGDRASASVADDERRGARPGEVSMSTFGHPGRYTYCIGENEEASPGRRFTSDAACRRRARSSACRGRRTPRHLGSCEPHGARARRLDRLIDGRTPEQQALSPLLPRAHRRSGARPDVRRRRMVEGRPHAPHPREGAKTYRPLLPDADHGEGTNLRSAKGDARPNPGRDDRQVCVDGGDSRRRGRWHRRAFFGGDSADGSAGETARAQSRARWNKSIDFRSGACHSSCRFWHKRSQVTIVRDRDTRRASPVRAAFLFALQFRRVTPPRWREHRGLKTP